MTRDMKQGPTQRVSKARGQAARRNIAPSKVTLTSRLASGANTVQRRAAPLGSGIAPAALSAWSWTDDPWMDAVHCGTASSEDPVQRKPSASAPDTVVQRTSAAGRANANVVQMSGWWDTIQRGAGIYLGITLQDEGSAYAKALMRHYVFGGGGEFNPETSSINFPTDAMWSTFMAGRPEIQRAMETEFQAQATTVAASGTPGGHVSTSITGVRLNELESMRWTLHGCHRIEIEMDYTVTDDGAGNQTVTFSNMHFRWIDVGDMHPGTVTETDSGEEIDDADLMGAGSSFPINIPFAAPGSSAWTVSGGAATQSGGWPSSSTATSTRNRG